MDAKENRRRKGKESSGKSEKEARETKKCDVQIEEGSKEERPRSLEIARKGIQTGGDFALMMSALMSDVIEGNITPQVANATVNAGGKLLKVVEMQLKYGKTEEPGRQFRLIG